MRVFLPVTRLGSKAKSYIVLTGDKSGYIL